MGGVSQLASFLQKRLNTERCEDDDDDGDGDGDDGDSDDEVLPASVSQQDEEQAAQDAGEAAVNTNQQSRHRTIRLITVAARTS